MQVTIARNGYVDNAETISQIREGDFSYKGWSSRKRRVGGDFQKPYLAVLRTTGMGSDHSSIQNVQFSAIMNSSSVKQRT